MHGRSPTVLVSLQDSIEPISSVTRNQLFQAASSFWSPRALQLVTTDAASSNLQLRPKHGSEDEVSVGYWAVQGTTTKKTLASFLVLQNLDHEQRIVWTAAEK